MFKPEPFSLAFWILLRSHLRRPLDLADLYQLDFRCTSTILSNQQLKDMLRKQTQKLIDAGYLQDTQTDYDKSVVVPIDDNNASVVPQKRLTPTERGTQLLEAQSVHFNPREEQVHIGLQMNYLLARFGKAEPTNLIFPEALVYLRILNAEGQLTPLGMRMVIPYLHKLSSDDIEYDAWIKAIPKAEWPVILGQLPKMSPDHYTQAKIDNFVKRMRENQL